MPNRDLVAVLPPTRQLLEIGAAARQSSSLSVEIEAAVDAAELRHGDEGAQEGAL